MKCKIRWGAASFVFLSLLVLLAVGSGSSFAQWQPELKMLFDNYACRADDVSGLSYGVVGITDGHDRMAVTVLDDHGDILFDACLITVVPMDIKVDDKVYRCIDEASILASTPAEPPLPASDDNEVLQ
jgi:hypothetical protein